MMSPDDVAITAEARQIRTTVAFWQRLYAQSASPLNCLRWQIPRSRIFGLAHYPVSRRVIWQAKRPGAISLRLALRRGCFKCLIMSLINPKAAPGSRQTIEVYEMWSAIDALAGSRGLGS